jgi:hypothetical protein
MTEFAGRTAVVTGGGSGMGRDGDRGTPRGTTPPTPPGIRVRTTAVRSGYWNGWQWYTLPNCDHSPCAATARKWPS